MLQTQIEELQKSIKKHEVDIYKLQNTVRSLESKNQMTEQQLLQTKTQLQEQADQNAKTIEE